MMEMKLKNTGIEVGQEYKCISGKESDFYTKGKIYKVLALPNPLDPMGMFLMEDDTPKCWHGWSIGVSFDEKFELASISKVYTSSKEDVSRAVLDFELGEEYEFADKGAWTKGLLARLRTFAPYPYYANETRYMKIRKLQVTEPVNPYADIQEDGQFKVVASHLSDGALVDVDMMVVDYQDRIIPLSDWIDHKDFAGYVFNVDGEMTVYADCWDAHLGHAVAIRFKVGE